LLAEIVCRGIRFFIDVVLVRHFSPDVIGRLNLSQALAVQGMGLSTCGLDVAGTRAVASGTVSPARMATTVVALRFVAGVVGWGVVVGVAYFVPEYRSVVELTALYGLSILTGAATIGWVAQAQQRMHVVAVALLAINIFYLGGVVLITDSGWPPWAVPLVVACTEGIVAVALWIWLFVTCRGPSRGLPVPASLRFLWDALPIGGANFLRQLGHGSDVLLLGLFVSKAEVGLYGTGSRLYSLGMTLIAIYLSVLLPELAANVTRQPESFDSALSASFRRSLLGVAIVTPTALLLTSFVLGLLFGAPFVAATSAVQILFLAWPVQLISGHFRTALVAQGRQRQDLGLVGVATIAHLIAKLSLIPLLGINGAALGTLTGELILLCLAWLAWRKKVH
jgi:O-antigen/teichoic acid export membrane protein